MRRFAFAVSSLIATAIAFAGGVGPAFATRVVPIGGTSQAGHVLNSSGGLAVWQISVIAVASAVVLATAVTFAVRLAGHRSQLRAAIH